MSLLNPRWKKLDTATLIELAQGHTIPEIAAIVGETPDVVRYALNRLRIKTKRKGKVDPIMVKEMRKQGMMLKEIANVFGVSPQAVWARLQEK